MELAAVGRLSCYILQYCCSPTAQQGAGRVFTHGKRQSRSFILVVHIWFTSNAVSSQKSRFLLVRLFTSSPFFKIIILVGQIMLLKGLAKGQSRYRQQARTCNYDKGNWSSSQMIGQEVNFSGDY